MPPQQSAFDLPEGATSRFKILEKDVDRRQYFLALQDEIGCSSLRILADGPFYVRAMIGDVL